MGDSEIARAIWTVGHSTHPLPRFVHLLERGAIKRLVDVRTVPRSRRMPHFSSESLARELPEHGIGYEHIGALGGFRRPRRHSPNSGWRHEGFRGYADHMETEEFQRALERLERIGSDARTAVMCAEAQWERCHRRLLSDALLVRGWRVIHLRADGRTEQHALTPFAVVDDGSATYPPEQGSFDIEG